METTTTNIAMSAFGVEVLAFPSFPPLSVISFFSIVKRTLNSVSVAVVVVVEDGTQSGSNSKILQEPSVCSSTLINVFDYEILHKI